MELGTTLLYGKTGQSRKVVLLLKKGHMLKVATTSSGLSSLDMMNLVVSKLFHSNAYCPTLAFRVLKDIMNSAQVKV